MKQTSPPVRVARPPRHSRPHSAELPEFESLDNAHRAALQMLDSFHRLLAQLDSTGLDDAARTSAREILAFFNGPGRHHHEDEEKHVFPGLLAEGKPELVKHIHRLMQDHGWLEEDWRELAPQIEAIADGYNWYDMAVLTSALPVFTALYLDHIALEESLVYPEAKKQLAALKAGRGSAVN